MGNRREFIRQMSGGAAAISMPALLSFAKKSNLPLRPITSGPNFHWFGYYDKLQFDPSNRYVLGMEVGFDKRTPTSDDVVKLGLIDLKENDKWIEIGKSSSWGWQQGCMLQWIPGADNEVIWNDRENDHFVSRILNIRTGKMRTLPKSVYALSPDGKWAIGTEFSRIQNLRPGYGYAGIVDPHENVKAPKEIGLYKIDLQTGEHSLLFSLDELASIPHNGQSVADNFHWINHLLVNTDGTRFTFLHRWRQERTDRQKMASSGFTTRMFTASTDGSDLFCIDPSGFTSHFVWNGPNKITAWTRPEGMDWGFWTMRDKTREIMPVGEGIMTRNGHNTFLPETKNDWILNDTYPLQETREQILYLFQQSTREKIELGRYYESPDWKSEWRCDLHPRASNDGKLICFDSTHGNDGRQIYLLDINTLKL